MSTEAVIERALLDQIERREINVDERWVEFVAATETGVETWSGRQYLRISGVVLKRFKKNPVILDSHNRWEAGAVIGRGDVRVEGRELIVRVHFAETERAETIWQLVKGGFINAVSVGFIPDRKNTLELAEGETDGDGESAIKGPAVVIKRWELFEISVVPVPADAEAVRRSFLAGRDQAMDQQIEATVRRVLQTAALDVTEEPEEEVTVGTNKQQDAAAGHTEARAAAVTETQTKEMAAVIPEELAARRAMARKAEIEAITPAGLEDVAQRCLLEGLDLDQTRQRLLQAMTDQAAPAGTPEPKTETQGQEKAQTLEDVSDDVLVRTLVG